MTKSDDVKASYIMIGGFLGAGKTTSVIRLAQQLTDQGLKVGIITNDQAQGLVDTALVKRQGFNVEEIAGGCFCCRFSSLKEAADQLTQDAKPDVFLAEPVGSCTDLIATVSYPLRRIYGEDFSIAPLSVLVDPERVMRMLGVREGRKFSDKVKYIYMKQLEESQAIVVNKVDLLSNKDRTDLDDALKKEFPNKTILWISAKEGDGFDDWYQWLSTTQASEDSTMEIDYDIYAEGEEALGWLNATLQLSSDIDFDGNDFLKSFAATLSEYYSQHNHMVAHLKMTLSPKSETPDLGSIHIVSDDHVAHQGIELMDPIDNGELVVNARIEGDPDSLKKGLDWAINNRPDTFKDVTLSLEHCDHFKPSRPEPQHRFATAEK